MPERSRWRRLLIVALVSGLIACSNRTGEDTAAPSSSSPPADATAVEGPAVALTDIVGFPVALRGGDHLVLADGGASGRGDSDDGPDHLRVWLAPAEVGAEARTLDFPTTGPLRYLNVGWNGHDFVFVGLRCPEPWEPTPEEEAQGYDSPGYPEGECGSTLWDVYRLDPATATLHSVTLGLDENEGSIRVFASGDGAVLLGRTDESGEPGWIVDDDGSISTAPTPSVEDDGVGPSSTICPIDGGLLAVGSSGLEADHQAPEPLADLHRAALLRDGQWEAAPLPALDVVADFTVVAGCLDGGVAIVGGRDADGLFAAVHVVQPNETGELAWQTIPYSMPRQPGRPVDIAVVDGMLLASVGWRPGQVPAGVDPAGPVPLYVWEDSTWRASGEIVGTPPRGAIILGDGEAILTSQQAEGGPVTFAVREL